MDRGGIGFGDLGNGFSLIWEELGIFRRGLVGFGFCFLIK